MTKGTNQHVTPHKGGGWQVIGAGNSKVTKVTSTKQEAVKIGRKISQNQHSELVIHGKIFFGCSHILIITDIC